MTEKKDLPYTEESIDLRDLILTLWKMKWAIILVVAIFGAAAFLVSNYLVAEQYESEAFITITEPAFITELETSIQTNLARIETIGLPGLAESTDLKDQTFKTMGITAYEEQRAFQFAASMQGTGQLRLVVTAEDPTLAAEAANAWAGVMKNRLNELFAVNEETISRLEGEVSTAEANWADAQLALEEYLTDSRLRSSDLQLAAARSILMQSLQEIDHNQLLLSDIQVLLKQIEDIDQAAALTTGTALSLITLQQRAAAPQGDPPLQIQIDQTMKTELTAAEANLILRELREALEGQNQQIGEEVVSLEDEIINLALVLEQEEFRIAQLTEDRDLARQAYTALSSQLEETRISRAQEDYWPLISAQALAPNEPVGPNVFLYTILASMLGFFICVVFVFLRDWWNLGEG